MAATQKLLATLNELYPSYLSNILIVNLPSYLVWFVKFCKNLLCEATASKIELAADSTELLQYYTRDNLPAYYKVSS